MAGKKHILFISSWYPTNDDPTLGIFNVYFARAVALYDQVTVLRVSANAQLSDPLKIEETKDHDLRTVVVHYLKPAASLSLVAKLQKKKRVSLAFKKGFEFITTHYGKPDLIHLNVAIPMGIPVMELSRAYKVPYVLNENWSGYTKEDASYGGLIQKWFTKKIVAGASAILPTSEYLKEAMLSHNLRGNYHVIPNVVNVNQFRPLEKSKKSETTTFIHVSSLNDREKNVSGLIRGFASAYKINKSSRLVIVGEGVDKTKYQQLVKDLKIESQVDFVGRLFADNLVKAFNAADAMVMFSHFETFCLVNIEAFACGKPVISSSVGAIGSYVNEERGLLVESGNEEQLSEALITFARNKQSYKPQQIRDYAVNNYSYEVIGKKLHAIYEAALKD